MGADADAGWRGRIRRLAWFAALYLASLAAFTALVYGLRAIIPR
jgi:hypothetical protein